MVYSSCRRRAGSRRTPRPATTSVPAGAGGRGAARATGSDEGRDLLARDLHGDVVTPATALAWAELAATARPGAGRRATRCAPWRPSRITWNGDERRALDAVRGALRRGAGSRGSSVEESAPAVLRGVLREALGRGDSDAAEKIIGVCSSGAGEVERAVRRRPWTC